MVRRKPKRQRGKGNRGTQQQQPQPSPQPPATPVAMVVTGNNQPQTPVGEGQSNNDNGNNKPRKWRRRYAKIELAFAGAIMLFTAAQAIFSSSQWYEMNKQSRAMVDQNEIMKKQMAQTDKTIEAMQLDQRPWLSINATTIRFVPGERSTCGYKIENTGRTPGKLNTMAFKVFVADKGDNIAPELEHSETWSTQKEWGFDIAPGQATAQYSVGSDFGKEKSRQIEAGERLLYLAISLTYSDISGRKYNTRRSFVYDPAMKTLVHHGEYDRMD